MPDKPEPKVPVTPPEQWVDKYGDYLYGFAMSRLRNPDAANDCVQDTFLAGIKALERFDGSRDIKFWLAVYRLGMTKSLKAVLTMISASSSRPYATEGQVLLHDMHNNVVNADAT